MNYKYIIIGCCKCGNNVFFCHDELVDIVKNQAVIKKYMLQDGYFLYKLSSDMGLADFAEVSKNYRLAESCDCEGGDQEQLEMEWPIKFYCRDDWTEDK